MLTKQDAVIIFRATILPKLKENETNGKDIVMRELEWSYFIDYLCKDGVITQSQYNRWSTPRL